MDDIFTPDEMKEIENSVAEAEKLTNAEITPVIVNYCWGNLHKKAQLLFEKYKLHNTKERNAVMILLVVKNRELLIYGDKGITKKVGVDFWVKTKDEMVSHFKENDFLKGMIHGIQNAGEQLAKHFPPTEDDVNELSNKVIHEK